MFHHIPLYFIHVVHPSTYRASFHDGIRISLQAEYAPWEGYAAYAACAEYAGDGGYAEYASYAGYATYASSLQDSREC